MPSYFKNSNNFRLGNLVFRGFFSFHTHCCRRWPGAQVPYTRNRLVERAGKDVLLNRVPALLKASTSLFEICSCRSVVVNHAFTGTSPFF